MRNWSRAVPAIVLVAVAAAGCSALVTDTDLTGDIIADLRTRQGAPIDDARLLLFRGNTQVEYVRTDARGRAVFRDVPRGTYGVLVPLQGDIQGLSSLGTGRPDGNLAVPITVVGGEQIPLEFTLLKMGTGVYEALVLDDEGLPIANVEIVTYTPDRFLESRVTNAKGRVRFEDIPFGPFGAYAIVPDSVGGPGVPPINHQGMFFDAGHIEARTYTMTRCRGTIRARLLDQADLPVPDYPVALFTATTYQRTVSTDAGGDALFTAVKCNEYFVTAEARSGFSVTNERGQGFQDGLRVTLGATLTPTIRVRRLP